MPTKRRTKRRKAKSAPVRRRKRTMKGEGPAWDWIKKTARNIHDFVKDKQLVSKGLSTVAPLAGPYASRLTTASNVAKTLGYGKRKPRRTRHRTRK